MVRIKSTTSVRSRRGPSLRRDFRRQTRVKRSRCQRRSVSGCTTKRAPRHAWSRPASSTRRSRSSRCSRGRRGAARRSTRICWRRNAFSAITSERSRTASRLAALTSAAAVRAGLSRFVAPRPSRRVRRTTVTVTTWTRRISIRSPDAETPYCRGRTRQVARTGAIVSDFETGSVPWRNHATTPRGGRERESKHQAARRRGQGSRCAVWHYFTQSDGPSSHLLWVKRTTCRSDRRIAWISP